MTNEHQAVTNKPPKVTRAEIYKLRDSFRGRGTVERMGRDICDYALQRLYGEMPVKPGVYRSVRNRMREVMSRVRRDD